jgi:hypothetical protein
VKKELAKETYVQECRDDVEYQQVTSYKEELEKEHTTYIEIPYASQMKEEVTMQGS